MDEMDRKILKVLQEGIPIKEKPFEKISSDIGVSVEEIAERVGKMKDEGIIRRFGASLSHRKIGFSANAMVVWNVPDEEVDSVGEKASSFNEVSHCYRRPRVEGKWRFNLYTMVHSDSKKDCERIAESISEKIGVDDYKLVYSTEEFKKTGVKI